MAGNQVGRRRAPKPTLGLTTTLERALDQTELPSEAREQLRLFARLIEKQFAEVNQSSYLGTPAPHTHEDDNSGGSLEDGAELVAYLAYLGDC